MIYSHSTKIIKILFITDKEVSIIYLFQISIKIKSKSNDFVLTLLDLKINGKHYFTRKRLEISVAKYNI